MDDATDNATGFNNGASAANEYTYDNNGNLTKDSNKGITNIAYNCLNLPSTVTFSDGNTITYSYAADGTKLRTVHTISGTTTQKDYCANVVYEDTIQKMLLTEEGYVDLENSNTYYYYLKDHQGNNRVVINKDGDVKETNHYYPFGGLFNSDNEQPYKYNGKELDTAKGLNWHDYGARHYDATLGRWLVVDPLAEKYYAWSPYNYCANNPVKFIDPNGKGFETAWDVFNIILGAKSFGNNISAGKYGAAVVDGVGVVLDAAAAVLPFVPGGISSGIKAARNVDDFADAVSASTKADNAVSGLRHVDATEFKSAEVAKPYTKSNLKLGQEMHKKFHTGEYGKEYRLPSGKRIDFLDIDNKTIYELKPFNPRAMKQGEKQLQNYVKELETMPEFQGWEWKTIIETY